ncbi:MAG: hypothetical protein JST00_28565 [Deltaproteobacteria bacterium]|nr:hypothetical protein [Deltaproteobacteria bacterium]
MARRGIALLFVFFALVVLTVTVSPRAARADQPGGHSVPVAVLALDSEDAEENAEALTGALKSRVRSAPGWSLIETAQSLGMLTAALKCPARPTPECQQKIADQIKAERYIYGYLAKGPQQGQVTAEIHLFQRGKPDTVVKESYSDNLKDANDDTLKKIAGRVVERLGGVALGVVIVRAPDQPGEIVVDGEKHVPLKDGVARIELAGGGHAIELAPTSGAITKRNVLVTPGRETVVEFTPTPQAVPSEGNDKPFPTRKVVGGGVMAVGLGLGVASVVSLFAYLDAIDGGEARAATVGKRGDTPCREYDGPSGPGGQDSCESWDGRAKKNSAVAIATGAAGGVALIVGAYLFFSEPKESHASATAEPPKPKVRVSPTLGGMTVFGTF